MVNLDAWGDPQAWARPVGIGLLVIAPVLVLVLLAVATSRVTDLLRGGLAAALVASAALATYTGWNLVLPTFRGRDIP